MPLTPELLDQHIYDARYKGASTVLASYPNLKREKKASLLVQFAQGTDRQVAARNNAREKLASAYRQELGKVAGK